MTPKLCEGHQAHPLHWTGACAVVCIDFFK